MNYKYKCIIFRWNQIQLNGGKGIISIVPSRKPAIFKPSMMRTVVNINLVCIGTLPYHCVYSVVVKHDTLQMKVHNGQNFRDAVKIIDPIYIWHLKCLHILVIWI